jgi:transcriptional regulator with XRE-family HTH domain
MALARMAASAGARVREERMRRHWTLRGLAERAGVSPALVASIEAGAVASLEAYARVVTALDLRPELEARDPRPRAAARPAQDVVHAAMGELEARRFHSLGMRVAIDEPYQHYQFAGRADVLAWDLGRRALLHIENRTRFSNLQEAAGSYNAKRTYLADDLARRWGLGRAGWASVTHVVVALWSAEVIHAVRLRTESFRAMCPDPADDFDGWWSGVTPGARQAVSTFVLCDPDPDVRERFRFASLDDALRVRPRYRDYAEAAERLGQVADRSHA